MAMWVIMLLLPLASTTRSASVDEGAATATRGSSEMELRNFLKDVGLESYFSVLAKQDCGSLACVQKLKESHLKELGMSIGHQIILQDAIQRVGPQSLLEMNKSDGTARSLHSLSKPSNEDVNESSRILAETVLGATDAVLKPYFDWLRASLQATWGTIDTYLGAKFEWAYDEIDEAEDRYTKLTQGAGNCMASLQVLHSTTNGSGSGEGQPRTEGLPTVQVSPWWEPPKPSQGEAATNVHVDESALHECVALAGNASMRVESVAQFATKRFGAQGFMILPRRSLIDSAREAADPWLTRKIHDVCSLLPKIWGVVPIQEFCVNVMPAFAIGAIDELLMVVADSVEDTVTSTFPEVFAEKNGTLNVYRKVVYQVFFSPPAVVAATVLDTPILGETITKFAQLKDYGAKVWSNISTETTDFFEPKYKESIEKVQSQIHNLGTFTVFVAKVFKGRVSSSSTLKEFEKQDIIRELELIILDHENGISCQAVHTGKYKELIHAIDNLRCRFSQLISVLVLALNPRIMVGLLLDEVVQKILPPFMEKLKVWLNQAGREVVKGFNQVVVNSRKFVTKEVKAIAHKMIEKPYAALEEELNRPLTQREKETDEAYDVWQAADWL